MLPFLFPLILTQNTCPLVEPMTGFNTTEYIRATWFIQQQQITGYQPVSRYLKLL